MRKVKVSALLGSALKPRLQNNKLNEPSKTYDKISQLLEKVSFGKREFWQTVRGDRQLLNPKYRKGSL